MSNNRTLANLADYLDSASAGGAITKRDNDFFIQSLTDSDIGGSPVTGFNDSSTVKGLITTSHVVQKGGRVTTTAGLKTILQGSISNFNPSVSATYDLGDSSNPLDEIILDSSSSLFFGALSMTSVLSSGTSAIAAAAVAATWYGDRAVVGGGGAGSNNLYNVIDYYDMTTPGNATDFGDLTVAREHLQGAVSDATYGLYFGGVDYNDYPQTFTNVIDYITISTTGNATDFGDMTVSGARGDACSDATYGVSTSITDYGTSNGLEYVTIASPGNATDFGDLTEVAGGYPSCMNDATYGLFAGGSRTSNPSSTIDYITIATPGNASDFGDLTIAVSRAAGCSDDTYGLTMGGYRSDGYWWTIDYVTIATTGNATDFGDLSAYHFDMSACSNGTYGNVNGNGSGGIFNTIEYVTIATPGNGSDFGDLTIARKNSASTSGSPS